MLISHVAGGLGNQLFQYALGRALSLSCGVPLLLDANDYSKYGSHQGFELARVLSCSMTLAEPNDVRAVLGWQYASLVRRVIARPELSWLRSRHLVVEPHFHYWPAIRNVQLPCYLTGYWQSERYFVDAVQQIREDITFRQPLANKNLEIVDELGRVNAVSLHVRRGDYTSNPKTLSVHGVCPASYYEASIRYVAARVESPSFFVFSDDMDWVKANLRIDFPCRYVDHNRGAESYNDMRLMSLCKHHIIANSSFSWWGAWLNPDSDKIVIAPKKWFARDTRVDDLFPSGWVTL